MNTYGPKHGGFEYMPGGRVHFRHLGVVAVANTMGDACRRV
jgi:hypothetical protein